MAGTDQTDDTLVGDVDLTRHPPGRYNVVLTNTSGAKSASGVRERAFDVVAAPPRITRPSASPRPGSPTRRRSPTRR